MSSLPPILYFAEGRDPFGNKVFGHSVRARRLISAYTKAGGVGSRATVGSLEACQDGIVVIDSWKAHQYAGVSCPFIISIVDAPYALPHPKSDIIINPNFGADTPSQFEFYGSAFPASVCLFGPEFFFSEEGTGKVRAAAARRSRGGIVLVPGGNKEEFWSQVNLDEVTEVGHRYDKLVSVLTGLQPKTFLSQLGVADIVVSSASISATEAILMGAPTLPVCTAADQYGIFTHLLESGLPPYSIISLKSILEGAIPDALGILSKRVGEHGASISVTYILNEYKRRRKNETISDS